MPALSGVLPVWYLRLTEHDEWLRGSIHVAYTMRWPFDGDARLDQDMHAANAGATSLQTDGDSGTTAAHHPGGAERDWPLPAAQASPAPQSCLSQPRRVTHRDAPE